MNKITEARLQQEIFTWHWNNFPHERGLLFHVPNGGYRNRIEAARMKGQGVVKGIPDLIYCRNGKAVFIEIKTETGRLSPDQKKIHQQLSNNCFEVHTITSLEEFKKLTI